MIEYQKEDLDFEVTLNSFSQEIVHKIMLIQKNTFDFERLISEKSNSGKSAIQLVKFCRKIIQDIERIVIGVKGYLQELNLGNFYCLIYKMFRILVISFNNLSEKFVTSLKNRKITEENDSPLPQLNKQDNNSQGNSKKKVRQIQYLDFVIKGLEQEQQKIQLKKKLMQKQLRQQSQSLAKITPSDTVNQLQNLNKELQKIINNSYKIAGENVLYRYQQLSKKILTFKKPQQIEEQLCNVFGTNMKKKFMEGMEKIIKELYLAIRLKQKEKMVQQILGEKPKQETTGTQTETDSKNRQIEQLNRQKKQLNNDIEGLKKSSTTLQRQLEKISQKFRQSKQNSQVFEKKVAELQFQMKKRIAQHFNSKLEYERTIENLNRIKLKQTTSSENISQFRDGQQKMRTQGNEQSTQKKFSKNRLKEKIANNYLPTRQENNERRQKNSFKNGFQYILQKLAELGLINEQQFNLIFQDLQEGDLDLKIQPMLIQFSEKFVNVRQSQQNPKSIFKKRVRGIEQGTQTNEVSKSPSKFHNNWKQDPKTQSNERSKKISSSKLSKLQMLKKQFLEKVNEKKTQTSLIKSNASKYYKKYKDYERKQFTTTQYKSTDNGYILEENNDQKMNEKMSTSTSKPKQPFNRKDISFQQLKLTKVQNKSNNFQRKYLHNKFKKTFDGQNNVSQQLPTKKPIFSLENYEVLRQVKIISDMISMKNDKNNYFLKNFMRNMLQELKKMKGNTFIEEILKKQLAPTPEKQETPQTKNRPKYISLEINTLR